MEKPFKITCLISGIANLKISILKDFSYSFSNYYSSEITFLRLLNLCQLILRYLLFNKIK